MAIQLICIDMDGTLLMNQHDIALVDQEAIEYALNQGVHVAITTGRVYNCARLYAKRMAYKRQSSLQMEPLLEAYKMRSFITIHWIFKMFMTL